MRIAVLTVVVLAVAGPAVADEAADKAHAAKLFQEGRDLITAGKIDEGCTKFEQSFKLDSAIGTKLNLADCLERKGLYAAAFRLFDEAAIEAAKTSKEGREDFARQRATALAARLVRIELRFAAEPPASTAVTIGGVLVAPAAWRQPRLVMPGATEVDVTPPDGEPFHITIEGSAGQVRVVDVPALGKPEPGTGTRTGTGMGLTGPGLAEGTTAPRRSRKLAYIVGGAGVALIGTSVILGFAAKGKFDDADCGSRVGLPDGMCTPAGQDQTDSARRLADVGTGVVIAGLAAVGVGVYLFVRAGRGSASSADRVVVAPAVSDGTVGVVVRFQR